jgi:hypothetical protein
MLLDPSLSTESGRTSAFSPADGSPGPGPRISDIGQKSCFEKLGQVKNLGTPERRHPRSFSGETVGKSGTYSVRHLEHRLPVEVTLIDSHVFPGCARCSVRVEFEFLRAVTNAPLMSGEERFRVVIHTLPVLDDDVESEFKAG